MFDSIGDLPLHPLVLHAAVIGVPLTLLLALLFAYPRTRSWARWALPVVALGATAATFVARASGAALMQALGITPGNPVGNLIQQHATLATQLMLIMLGVSVLAVANSLVVGRVGAANATSGRSVRDLVLVALLVAACAVAAFWVYRVGDLGAQAVWNPTGTQEYDVPVR